MYVGSKCQESPSCIRFSSDDRVKASDVESFVKFGKSDLFDNRITSENETSEQKINNIIFRGEPKCVNPDETIIPNSTKEFIYVG